jgi:hypothetical protein
MTATGLAVADPRAARGSTRPDGPRTRASPTARSAPALLVALCFAYLLVPGHPLSWLGGLPLDFWSLALAAGLGIVVFGFGLPSTGRRTIALALLVLLLALAKVALWSGAPTYGLAASYYSRARVGGEIERSTDWRASGGPSGSAGSGYTRIERRPGHDGFGTFFFNDVERFNYYEGEDPDRQALPFAARWDGFLHAPADGGYPFALAATGMAVLSLDGRPLLTVAAGGDPTDRAVLPLSRGAHAIRVEFVNRSGRSPTLSVDWDPGGGLLPLGPPFVTAEPADAAWLARDAVAAWAARATDAAFALVLLGLCVGVPALRLSPLLARRGHQARPGGAERPVLAVFLLGILVHALLTTGELYRRAVILEGGQDWLTYESYARDILLNGPLMTLGEPLGAGKPFFFQPFYPYVLAGLHWLTGEDLWGPVVLQLLGLGVSGVLLHALAKRLFGPPAAWATLLLFVVLRATQLDWVARKLLSENLYFVVLPAAVLLLVRFLDDRRWIDLTLAGLLLGVASITRAPTLLYVPPAALVVALALRREGASPRSAGAAVALVLVATAAVAALVPLRNYVVSGRPALMATNGGATLLLAHSPSPKVRLARVDQDPVYNALSLDRPTREVLEFVRQDPLGYAGTLVPLALYTVGVSGAVEGMPPLAPEILALTLAYFAAVLLVPGARSLRAGLLHLFVAIHFLVMVTFLPYVYGYRQVLPMNLLMLVFAGGLLARALCSVGVGWRIGLVGPRPPAPSPQQRSR